MLEKSGPDKGIRPDETFLILYLSVSNKQIYIEI